MSAPAWKRHALPLLATVLLVHLAAVWAAPRLIMQVLLHSPAARAMDMHNRAAFPPPTTAASRSVVLPSPDMLYSVCAFDLRDGPLRVRAQPQWPQYWSIALYAANSDNFFVINDRQAAGQPVDLWLQAPGDSRPAPAGSRAVAAPSVEGFLLMRVLTGDYAADQARVEPARRTLSCTPAT